MTQPIIHEPNGYEEVTAELRRIADALDTVPPGFGPAHVSVDIHAGKPNETASIAAVDAVALAVLGKKGEPRPIGRTKLHHNAESNWRPVHVSIYQQVPGPAETELEQLRARVAELESQKAAS